MQGPRDAVLNPFSDFCLARKQKSDPYPPKKRFEKLFEWIRIVSGGDRYVFCGYL